MNNNFDFRNGGDVTITIVNNGGELMLKVIWMLINLIMFVLALPFAGPALAREFMKSDNPNQIED